MADGGYRRADVAPLLEQAERPEPAREGAASLVAAAWELREYLSTAAGRPRASREKVAMGLAVLDIWNGSSDTEGGADPGVVTAATASLLAATARIGAPSGEASEIAANVRNRIAESFNGDEAWATVSSLADGIGDATGFRVDVEAARAERLWGALLAFAADDSSLVLGPADPGAPRSLASIRARIRATGPRDLDEVKAEFASETGPAAPPAERRPWYPTDLYDAPPPLHGAPPLAEPPPPAESPRPLPPDWEQLGDSDPDAGAQRVRVWFGTNRQPLSRSDPGSAYSNRLAPDELFYGVCQVNVPRVEDATGGLFAFLSAWLRRGSPRGRATVERYLRFDGAEAFAHALQGEAARNSSERTGLVFLHGYATSFADAATTAAGISLSIKHRGPTAMFTWASRGTKTAYRHDERVVDQSRRQLTDFLGTLTERAGLEHVDIIVHSLGNRLFLRALGDWFTSGGPSKAPLRHIYLGAPDIDQPEFLKGAGVYARAGAKTTLYGSDSDSALLASRAMHRGVPRVGLMPPVTTVPDVDTIETSRVDVSRLRHAYITEAPAIRSDIFSVQDGKYDPAARPNVHLVGAGLPLPYWRFD